MNTRLDVFFSDEDRLAYSEFLQTACRKYGVQIRAYCLMINHAHFTAVFELVPLLNVSPALYG